MLSVTGTSFVLKRAKFINERVRRSDEELATAVGAAYNVVRLLVRLGPHSMRLERLASMRAVESSRARRSRCGTWPRKPSGNLSPM